MDTMCVCSYIANYVHNKLVTGNVCRYCNCKQKRPREVLNEHSGSSLAVANTLNKWLALS